jgi:hypothetical protein
MFPQHLSLLFHAMLTVFMSEFEFSVLLVHWLKSPVVIIDGPVNTKQASYN